MSFFNDDFTADDFINIIDQFPSGSRKFLYSSNIKPPSPKLIQVEEDFEENIKISNDLQLMNNRKQRTKDEEIIQLREEILVLKQEMARREEIVLELYYLLNNRVRVIENRHNL